MLSGPRGEGVGRRQIVAPGLELDRSTVLSPGAITRSQLQAGRPGPASDPASASRTPVSAIGAVPTSPASSVGPPVSGAPPLVSAAPSASGPDGAASRPEDPTSRLPASAGPIPSSHPSRIEKAMSTSCRMASSLSGNYGPKVGVRRTAFDEPPGARRVQPPVDGRARIISVPSTAVSTRSPSGVSA